ncbi:alpha/beta hydrolase [Ramlibacter sp. MAHUQ-53]|uniref:alpha/beta hydrolase n=1 Tax=unclassified Ramlibacter TaxID=2617605 RepID=UPI003631FA5C
MKYDDTEWLEQQYNNRARVPEHGEHLARWARDSQRVRASAPCTLDIAYGPTPGQALDVFPAQRARAPVVVFIHGGYWRSLDKADHSFIAPAFTQAGACVVVPNYDLCPAVTLPEITMQMVRALAWTWKHIADFGGDPRRITLAGHSAGGHLAAMMLACYFNDFDRSLPSDLVTRALSISGLFDLEPLRHTPSLQAALRLTPEDALRASPALLPAPRLGSLYAVAGGKESMEFLRHNELIRQAWGAARVPVVEALPGLNHFSILDSLVEPGSRLNQLALSLL